MLALVPISESIGCPLIICVRDKPMTKRATAATAMANMIQKLSMFCAGFDVVLADRDAKSIQNYKFVEISFFPGLLFRN